MIISYPLQNYKRGAYNMDNKKLLQIAIIEDADPQILQEKINQELLKHRSVKDIEITGAHCLIKYEVETIEPDTPALAGTPVIPDYHISLLGEGRTGPYKRVCIELFIPEDHAKERYCCECENYNWGKNCPYRNGRIALKDNACDMFNILITTYRDYRLGTAQKEEPERE